ncbi:MAG: mechanosensitive ion channel family protein [Candidatus Latescibacterota bacterium]
MEINSEKFIHLLIPFAIIFVSLFIGLFVKRVVIKRIIKATHNTAWIGDEIIVNSIDRMIVFWFLLAGLYGAALNFSFSEKVFVLIQKSVIALFIISASIAIAKIISEMVKFNTSKIQGAFPSTTIFSNLAKIIVFIIGFLILLQSLGIPITPLITALGVGGLAVALALQETLSNLFAGLQIIASRQVVPGDYVKLDSGEEGYVVDITWRNTTIRSLPNNTIIVPNSKLASAIITNYNLPEQEMSVLVEIGVSYSSNLEQVERVTIEVAKEVLSTVQGGVAEFEPFIRYHTFADFSINFSVILRGRQFVDQYLIKHEFIKQLHKRFNKENISIPFPIRTVYLEKNDAS